jgi:formate dehydrogenase maturation protein FdhE
MTTCPACTSSDVVGFTLAPKGEPLRFTHCRNCEHRWWESTAEHDTVALDRVLSHIAA